MKKLCLTLLLSGSLLVPAHLSVYASDVESQTKDTSEVTVEAKSNSTNKFGEGVNVIEDVPQDLENGLKFLPINRHSGIRYVKVANIRYNDEYLFMEVEVCSEIGYKHNMVDQLKNLYKITQPYSDNTGKTESADDEELTVKLTQIPTEMEGDIHLLDYDVQFPNKDEIVRFTVPYKLAQPIEAGSKVYIEFADEQILELELESNSDVI